jgi:hypothetical protein
MSTFRKYLREKRIVMKSPKDFRRFIMITGRDPRAREALLARNARATSKDSADCSEKWKANKLDL